MLQSWIPAIVSILTGIVAIAISYTVTKTRVDALQLDKTQFQSHLESASKELQEAIKTIAVLSREQSIINAVTTKTLEALTKRVEEQDRRIADQDGTLKLLMELVRRLEKANV